MTSSAQIIHAHILASTFSWKFDLNKWKIGVFIGLTILHRAACSLTVWHTACLLYSALHGGAAWACGYAASKEEVHMHEQELEQQLTNTCIRCNMYTPPSKSSMHSHMRRSACGPTPINLS